MDKTILNVLFKYDDAVGVWYECSGCGNQSFTPDFDNNNKETDVFKFCPYCGKEIEKINSNGY